MENLLRIHFRYNVFPTLTLKKDTISKLHFRLMLTSTNPLEQSGDP